MLKFLNKHSSVIVFFSFSALYIYNLSRSIYGGDVGDLVTAAYIGGVPHAPGYPLFTLLGFILSHALPFFTPAFSVGLISAISNALSVTLIFLIIERISKNKVIALFGSLTVGFSYLFWFYGEIAEVFAFNNFFAVLLFFLAINYYFSLNKKYLFFLTVAFGLSLGNHHTITLIVPGVALLIFSRFFKQAIQKPLLILQLIGCVFLGLLIYLYVPIAASHNPPINWDHVHDINSFFHLVLRRDYGTFNAGPFGSPNMAQRLVIFKYYSFHIITQATIPIAVLSLLGCIWLFIHKRLILFSLLTIFLLSGPVFITYAGFPFYSAFFSGVYERFIVLSSIFFIMFSPFGLLFVIEMLRKVFKKEFIPLFYATFFLIPLLLFKFNFPKTNLSQVWIGDTVAADYLNSLPKNSIIFSGGDTVLFNMWYMHYARHVRPDVRIININDTKGESFFLKTYNDLERKYPKEKGNDIFYRLLQEASKKYPVYSYQPISIPGKDLKWVPYGLVFKLSEKAPSKEEFTEQAKSKWQMVHIPSVENEKAIGNLTISEIPTIYASALVSTGQFFESEYKDHESALPYYKRAISIDPHYSKAYSMLGIYYLGSPNQCALSEGYFKSALENNKFEPVLYYLLYAVYKDCIHDNKKADIIKKEYEEQYKSDFMKDVEKTLKSMNKKT